MKLLCTEYYKWVDYYNLHQIQTSLHQANRQVLKVYNSHRQLVEGSLPPSSLQIFGLEHKNSQAFPHCTAAESHKVFCLLGLLRQLPCEPF